MLGVEGDRITDVWIMRNPEKLTLWCEVAVPHAWTGRVSVEPWHPPPSTPSSDYIALPRIEALALSPGRQPRRAHRRGAEEGRHGVRALAVVGARRRLGNADDD